MVGFVRQRPFCAGRGPRGPRALSNGSFRHQFYGVSEDHTHRTPHATRTTQKISSSWPADAHCPPTKYQIMRRPILTIFATVASVSFAQDYGDNYADYADGQDDNLYANYAAKQQAKEV